MRKIILSMILVSIFISHALADIPLKFFREEISITLKENSILVRGLYFFKNKTHFEVNAVILYPFPIDSTHLYPQEIKVLDPKNLISFRKKENEIEWPQYFVPHAIETIFVEYKQTITEKSATYILTTTKSWKEAIELSKFIIEAPLEFKQFNISIKPDSVKTIKDKQFYYITRTDFSPIEDLKITWH